MRTLALPLFVRIVSPIVALAFSWGGTLSAATFTVKVGPGFTFSPSTLTVQAGDTVTWSGLSGIHTVTGDTVPDLFCGSVNTSCSRTFDQPGTFPYHCIPHGGFGMKATVIVKPAPGSPPTVEITNPSDSDAFPAPASLHLEAKASDVDGSVASVEFFANGSSLGVDGVAPFAVDSVALPQGNYTVTARATDNTGLISTSAPVKISIIAADRPVMSKVELNGLGVLSFDYTSEKSLQYIIQSSPVLIEDKWTSLETNKASGPLSHYSKLLTPGPLPLPPQGYYRVLVRP